MSEPKKKVKRVVPVTETVCKIINLLAVHEGKGINIAWILRTVAVILEVKLTD